MAKSIKTAILNGAMWTGLERVLNQVVGFVITIALARLLAPSDYGVVGLLSVFLCVSQLFIDAGFATALVQKKDRTDVDYSTVFWCNVGIAFICYVILFLGAPFIADFYHMPILCNMMRVLGISLVINALCTIQVTRLTILLDFKTQAQISFSNCLIGGVVGLTLAFYGIGAWALVFQSLFSCVYCSVLYWCVSKWRPKFIFSKSSFRTLFAFGSKLLISNFINMIYNNIAPVIIGRKYSAGMLGCYSRAESLVRLPCGVFDSTLGRVMFPIFSSIQDDEQRLRNAYNKYLRLVTSVVVPAMLLIGSVSEPLILTLIGERWIECVPFVMVLALGFVADPITTVNLNILYVKGRSDVVLRWEFVKKAIAISLILVAIQFGVIWLCVGRAVYGYIALVINIHACAPFIGMSFWQQVREVWKMYATGLLSAVCAFSISYLVGLHVTSNAPWYLSCLRLIVSGAFGLGIYIGLAILLRFEVVEESKGLLAKLFRGARK